MENIEMYNRLKSVPKDALKEITAGRLKGKSDISPQWRIEKLTEVFGVFGFGWKYENVKREFVEGSNSEVAVFVDINLFVKMNDEWSDPIPGNGGSMFVANERNGLYTSDEAIKMATTDAIGTAAKMLGLAADIYRGLGGKYSQANKPAPETKIEVKTWLTEEQFKKALKSTPEQIEAVLKVYGVPPKGMKKEYREQLQNKLKELSK